MAGALKNRHKNLVAILKDYRSLADAASAVDVSANYLSQLKGGKNIGHVMARRLEAGFGLEPGWLDQDHGDKKTMNLSEHQLTQHALALNQKSRIRLIKRLVSTLPD